MKSADASPTKDFFVTMITRDISLDDCVLDLLDNCVDGARRIHAEQGVAGGLEAPYKGFKASITISPDRFLIEDNCGGISISNAIDYAFHFGRRVDAPKDADFSIGLYGIGMKRAILKIGREIEIHSSTKDEAFLCKISVDNWLERPEWEFDMADADKIEGTGTAISISGLYGGIAAEFGDPVFCNELVRTIARDYALILGGGFEVSVNGVSVEGLTYNVRVSDEFQPFRHQYKDETGVEVEVLAGMAAPPPDSTDPSERLDGGYFGWFVICNDRVVIAADKSEHTVWGDERFPRWHPQYNGFMGIVMFRSEDPSLLPWTTTKRGIDETSPLYRRAINVMKTATTAWIEYTNQRKSDFSEAKRKEDSAKAAPLFQFRKDSAFVVPKPTTPQIRMVSVVYRKPVLEVRKAADALGDASLAATRVGERTFDYFMKNEVVDD